MKIIFIYREGTEMLGRRRAVQTAGALCVAMALAGCGTSPTNSSSTSGQQAAPKMSVVATINAWGSIASQLGGDKVTETSIITNPDTDPHDYEPTPADARTVADAKVFVANGIGYDAWADKLLNSNPNAGLNVVKVG